MTFTERKAARIANGMKQNKFFVRVQLMGHGFVDLPTMYTSRAAAENAIDTGKIVNDFYRLTGISANPSNAIVLTAKQD